PPPLAVSNDGARDLIEADPLQAIGLNGTNVTVAEWDAGYANHTDFLSRTIIGDPGEGSNHYHSTHVAGTVLGDGSESAGAGGSAFQWKGVAPNATLVTFEWPDSGGSEALAEANDSVVNSSAVLSQNSWGYAISSSVCSLLGDYDSFARTYDVITAGIGMRPQTVVFSAGNERNKATCSSSTRLYNTSAGPGAMAKNVITVGAVDKSSGMSSFSSWGPADDGRIKPEVVAVGVSVKSTNTNTGYTTLSGTSMASPGVTGALALFHEAYKAAHAGNDPNVATDKAVLIHTAVDQNNTGPDYSTGYGLVNATKAVAKARADRNSSGLLVQSPITNGENKTYHLNVSAGQSFLNITLAWNDYPGTAGAAVTLVNDLDLIVLHSNGTRSHPWTLAAATPGNPAFRNATDATNPQEQVRVDSPAAGNYTIIVSGVSVPQAPQNFTLVLDDTQPPQWANLTVSVSNNSAFAARLTQFNASWSDDFLLDSVLFELDGANTTVASGITTSSQAAQVNLSLAAGSHSHRWYANDTSGNWNGSSAQSLTLVPQATATTLLLNGTESNLTLGTADAVNATARTNVTGLTVTLSWNATGYGNSFTNGTTSVTNISSASLLGSGFYNITAATVATTNHSASTSTRFLTIAGAPQVSLSGPANGSALAPGSLINLTIATDSPNLTIYNNGTANFTLASPYRINTSGWSDGTTTLTVWASDTLGNIGSSLFRF
ncbi:MAG TPA: S8 family serine peptidase, partial [archaeon]|nr:S8 family serine peptidase [archaeon]